jgi:4-hydroxybenzoate polyprenyltransferase
MSATRILNTYLNLLRVKHYVKNLLIFIPLFFSQTFYNIHNILICVCGFITFSITASIIYVINDIRDINVDRQHTTKSSRPLAAGHITIKNAKLLIAVLIMISLSLGLIMVVLLKSSIFAFIPLGLYFILNIGYSFGLKNIPILDVIILASGFVLRVVFGGLIINITVSFWLYLVISMGSFYLGFGKRKNEIQNQKSVVRIVNDAYSYRFLDQNMYMCQSLIIVFYTFWSIDAKTIEHFHTSAFVYTVPIVFMILLKYSLNIEKNMDGDPTMIFLHDKILIFLTILFILMSIMIILL